MHPHMPHPSLGGLDRGHHPDERQQHFIQSDIIPAQHSSPHPLLMEKFEEPATAPRIRKKGGRGPGKKDAKDKTGISVRWEEADLTDRLINALHSNDLWAGVFIATSTAEHSRAVIGMPKSDLQREIARYLFQDDPRFDLDDSRTIDLLGTSVKNKVNKIRKLFSECKDELGPAANTLNDEHDIPPDSELSRVWTRVKDKLPQFFQVRDIVNRPVVSSQGMEMSPITESAGPVPPNNSAFRGMSRSVATPFPMEQSGGGIPYGASPLLSPIQPGTGRQHQQFQRYYPPSIPPPASRSSFVPPYSLETPSNPDLTGPSSSSGAHQNLVPLVGQVHPIPQPFNPRFSRSSVNVRQATPPSLSPFPRPQPAISEFPFLAFEKPESAQGHSPPFNNHPGEGVPGDEGALGGGDFPHSVASSASSPEVLPPSPPLSQTMFTLFRALESRKRTREEQRVSYKRMKLEHRERDKERQERERARWHEREVLRLQIQLERIRHGEMGTEMGDEEEQHYEHQDPTMGPGGGGAGSSSTAGTGGGMGMGLGGSGDHLQHLQHHLESHERGSEEEPRLDISSGSSHHQSHHHRQHSQHSHLSLHGATGSATEGLGTSSAGEATLDALANLREGSGNLRT